MEQLFSAGKAYLKINSLVKTPLHEVMAVERSGLWAPVHVLFLFLTRFHANVARSNGNPTWRAKN